MRYEFKLLDGECFWGGSVIDGKKNPFTAESDFSHDYRLECHNQVMPLFLSNKGRYIWSETPFSFAIKDGSIIIEGEDVALYEGGTTLKEAYLSAMKAHFHTDRRRLPMEYFAAPQFNTWMEFIYHPTQEKVLSYAEAILANGFAPGIFIIDEGWQCQYGTWKFDPLKFPNPKTMVEKLHDMGFKVMLWVVPWVRADGLEFVMSTAQHIPVVHKDAHRLFLRDANNDFAMMHWWNGISAMLDMRKDCDREYLTVQLERLMNDYGIDGFKFDGGKVGYGGYHTSALINGQPHENHIPWELNIAWNEFGRKYEYHEYKDTFKGGGDNNIARLADCRHAWVGGADILIPDTIMQGLMGHPFTCPDMVAGGSWVYSVDPDFQVDEEMFIRMAQASVLCPMVQFSWAPWRALSEKSLQIVKDAVAVRQKLLPYIMERVEKSFDSGEPIVRSLEYAFPHQGLECCMDCFMLGEKYLVAPVTTQGAVTRTLMLPEGQWKYLDGTVYSGGEVTVAAPIEVLPYFEKC